MRSLFRSVTRLLLLVMLTTVFSPTFGWEAAQVMAAHDESPAMYGNHDDHESHDDHGQHDAAKHDGCGSECAGGAPVPTPGITVVPATYLAICSVAPATT